MGIYNMLVGLWTCLFVSSTLGLGTRDDCDQFDFGTCALQVSKIDDPMTLEVSPDVCNQLQAALQCLTELWDKCGYHCTDKAYEWDKHPYNCTIHDKRYFGPMNRTPDPCTVITHLMKCKEYNCPYGEFYPNVIPEGFSPDLANVQYTFAETLQLTERRKCAERPVDRFLNKGSQVKNIVDCKHCKQIKSNWQHFLAYINEPLYVSRCQGSTVQHLVVDIWMLGTQHQTMRTLEPGVRMYVLTLNLASGEVAGESWRSLKARNFKVSHVEVETGVIHFYLDDIPKEGSCIKAIVEKRVQFDVQQPGSARVYSYYEPEYFHESVLALVNESSSSNKSPVAENPKCSDGTCSGVPSHPLTSLILTTLICFVASLLTRIDSNFSL